MISGCACCHSIQSNQRAPGSAPVRCLSRATIASSSSGSQRRSWIRTATEPRSPFSNSQAMASNRSRTLPAIARCAAASRSAPAEGSARAAVTANAAAMQESAMATRRKRSMRSLRSATGYGAIDIKSSKNRPPRGHASSQTRYRASRARAGSAQARRWRTAERFSLASPRRRSK